MSATKRQGRASSLRLALLALVTMALGWALLGLWVACYFKCARGMEIVYNYYAAVWAGGLAILSGLFQLYLVCCWNKTLRYINVFLNVAVLLSCLVCAALHSHQTYLEVEATPAAGPRPSTGVVLSVLQAIVAASIMPFALIACTARADNRLDEEEDTPQKQNSQSEDTCPDDACFFERVPGIYKGGSLRVPTPGSLGQQRPQEGSHGQDDGCQGNGDRSNGRPAHSRGAMIVDGQESVHVWVK